MSTPSHTGLFKLLYGVVCACLGFSHVANSSLALGVLCRLCTVGKYCDFECSTQNTSRIQTKIMYTIFIT